MSNIDRQRVNKLKNFIKPNEYQNIQLQVALIALIALIFFQNDMVF